MIERVAKKSAKLVVREAKAQATVVGSMVGVMWAEEAVDFVLGGRLDALGIHPRTAWGLLGILFAPFLHAGFGHLIANTIPLIVLSVLIMLRRKRDLLVVSVASALVGGLGIWLIAPSNTVHLGASILVFGYLGYLLARGLFERKVWSIAGSVVAFVLYGGALWGVLPGQVGISWQGHLFGFVGGVLAARWLSSRDSRIRVRSANTKPPAALKQSA
ncbi:MAG: rhomboid family intramembrane serine protease [Polyangiaceae bacterium]